MKEAKEVNGLLGMRDQRVVKTRHRTHKGGSYNPENTDASYGDVESPKGDFEDGKFRSTV